MTLAEFLHCGNSSLMRETHLQPLQPIEHLSVHSVWRSMCTSIYRCFLLVCWCGQSTVSLKWYAVPDSYAGSCAEEGWLNINQRWFCQAPCNSSPWWMSYAAWSERSLAECEGVWVLSPSAHKSGSPSWRCSFPLKMHLAALMDCFVCTLLPTLFVCYGLWCLGQLFSLYCEPLPAVQWLLDFSCLHSFQSSSMTVSEGEL